MLLDQDRAGKPEKGCRVGKDPDDGSASFDLLVHEITRFTPSWVCQVSVAPVGRLYLDPLEVHWLPPGAARGDPSSGCRMPQGLGCVSAAVQISGLFLWRGGCWFGCFPLQRSGPTELCVNDRAPRRLLSSIGKGLSPRAFLSGAQSLGGPPKTCRPKLDAEVDTAVL